MASKGGPTGRGTTKRQCCHCQHIPTCDVMWCGRGWIETRPVCLSVYCSWAAFSLRLSELIMVKHGSALFVQCRMSTPGDNLKALAICFFSQTNWPNSAQSPADVERVRSNNLLFQRIPNIVEHGDIGTKHRHLLCQQTSYAGAIFGAKEFQGATRD